MEGESQKAIEIHALVGSTEASFTGKRLKKKALVAAGSADEARKRESARKLSMCVYGAVSQHNGFLERLLVGGFTRPTIS